MQLINNSYYETFSSLCKKWGSVQAGTTKFIGVNTFGVRSTYSNEDILRNRKVYTVIHEFQTVLDTKSSLGRCHTYRVRKDKTLFTKPNDYGWIYFPDRMSAEGFVRELKELAKEVIRLEIVSLQEFSNNL